MPKSVILKSVILITGDFNINLLNVNEGELYSKFFDTMTSLSYYPKITLPTRFSINNGSLIDNIFCKLTDTTINAQTGILLKQFSDHQPYFISLSTIQQHTSPPKYITIHTNNPESMQLFYNDILQQDIMKHINTYPSSNPSTNYNIIQTIIINAKNKHLPSKNVKYHKHKHKKKMDNKRNTEIY